MISGTYNGYILSYIIIYILKFYIRLVELHKENISLPDYTKRITLLYNLCFKNGYCNIGPPSNIKLQNGSQLTIQGIDNISLNMTVSVGPLKGFYKLQRQFLLLRKEYELYFIIENLTAKIQLLFNVRALKMDIIDIEIIEIGDIGLDDRNNDKSFLRLLVDDIGEIVMNHDKMKEELTRVLSPQMKTIIQEETHKVLPRLENLITSSRLYTNITILLCFVIVFIVINFIFSVFLHGLGLAAD